MSETDTEALKREILATLYGAQAESPFGSYGTDSIVEEVVDTIDFDVEESDLDYALNRLDEEYLVDYSPALNSRGTISLTPRGVDELQQATGDTFLEADHRYYILDELEDLERDNPGARFDGEDFRDKLDLDDDLVDLNMWYMVKKGWVDASLVMGSPPYTALQIEPLGRQELDRYKTQSQPQQSAAEAESGSKTEEQINIEELIGQEEDINLEYKETFLYDVHQDEPNSELKEKAVQEVCAFANTEGGLLMIGVEDDSKEITGLERDLKLMPEGKDEFERQINQEISSRIGSPFASLFTRIEFEEIDEKEVCVVRVDRAPEPVYCDETLYVRNGSSSIPLDTPEAVQYIEQNWS
ncbi:AlbA family DNA-binding domain-containing protein [Halopiger thermotolerans]